MDAFKYIKERLKVDVGYQSFSYLSRIVRRRTYFTDRNPFSEGFSVRFLFLFIDNITVSSCIWVKLGSLIFSKNPIKYFFTVIFGSGGGLEPPTSGLRFRTPLVKSIAYNKVSNFNV